MGVAFATVVVHPARAQTDPAEEVDACIRSEMASRGVHGAQVAVMRDGEMVLERAYGTKHRDRPDPVDTHTQFRIGSTTKSLTAFAIMQQVDAGAIDLDAPITTYLEGFELAEEGQAEAITVRHLLTHASGLHDTSAFDESDLFGPTDPGAMGRWVDEQAGQAPYAPPGRFWNYSSANYMYAGHILEEVTGTSYPDYMDARVFAPAGMADSTLHAEEAVKRGNFAYGHFQNPFSGRLEIYTLNDANNWARHPTGYANSTAGDLVRFATLMMNGGGDLLSDAAAAEMQRRQQYRDLRADQYYGLGTFIEFFRGNEMVHHDGGAWGWSATMKWIPEAGVAVATTSNIGGGLLSTTTACALNAYVEAKATESPPCRLDRDGWGDFVGTYRGSLNTGVPWTFHITRPTAGGNLRMRLVRQGAEDRLYQLTQDCNLWLNSGPGSFQAPGLGTITFIHDPVEPGVIWLRHRFFVAGRRPEPPPEPEPIYLPALRMGGDIVGGGIIGTRDTTECRDWQRGHPEWIFCDDFESDGPMVARGRYFEYGNAGGDFVPEAGVGLAGSRGMRARFRAGAVGAGGMKLAFGRNPNTYMKSSLRADEDFREVYYRQYLRLAPGWVGNPAKLSRATVFVDDNDWSQAMIAHLWGGRGEVLALDPVRCVGPDSRVKCHGYNDFPNMDWLGYAFGTTPLFATAMSGGWFCIEAHVRLNTPGRSDGLNEFWIDDGLEARRDGLDFVRSYTNYAINAIFFENYWNDGSPRDQERFFDNIVVSTERIGCLADAPAPAPPTQHHVWLPRLGR